MAEFRVDFQRPTGDDVNFWVPSEQVRMALRAGLACGRDYDLEVAEYAVSGIVTISICYRAFICRLLV